MDHRRNALCMGMKAAGCGQAAIDGAARLMESGSPAELVRHLRRCRCELVEEMHESQRRVDRMDYLIRQAMKDTE